MLDGSGQGDAGERMALVAGLIFAPGVLAWLSGLEVGIGMRLVNGCTSGHGVCGISRLGPRGIVTTQVYLRTETALRSMTEGF